MPQAVIDLDDNDDKDNNKATAVTFKPVLIKVSRNYVYEEPELLNDIDYQSIFKLAKGMNKNINDRSAIIFFIICV